MYSSYTHMYIPTYVHAHVYCMFVRLYLVLHRCSVYVCTYVAVCHFLYERIFIRVA